MTKRQREEQALYIKICNELYSHYHDWALVERWLWTENYFLGGISPVELFRAGRGERLIKFIKQQLKENELVSN